MLVFYNFNKTTFNQTTIMKTLIYFLFVIGLLSTIKCVKNDPNWLLYEENDDSRVVLQGFYWESYRHGHINEFPEITPGVTNINKFWYEIVSEKAPEIREGRFDVIWLPPCSKGSGNAGYGPTELFNPSNMYGDSAIHREMLAILWDNGIEPVADIVINHRNGTGSWAGFSKPNWGTQTICNNDEAFTDNNSEVYNLDVSLRGNDEEAVTYDENLDRTYSYNVYRDIDHTNNEVNNDIIKTLLFYKKLGYRGWRYDMAHGFHASRIAYYNRLTGPTFCVGEYDWGSHDAWRGWIYHSATDTTLYGQERLTTAPSVFDFSTYFSLKNAIGYDCNNSPNYDLLYGFGNGLGLLGDTTDGIYWKTKSVTFLENHDTGWRTNEDGSSQDGHDHDSFENNWQVEQAYAYTLTHPGIPCVFWKHYFDWGDELQNKIKALINARKVAGINSSSNLNLQNNARNKGIYAAMINGKEGQLYVRIGGDDNDWKPSDSGYSSYREYAFGNGWKVWISFKAQNRNESFQFSPLNDSIKGIPMPIKVEDIEL